MRLSASLKFAPDKVVPLGLLVDSGRETLFEYDAAFLSLGLEPAPFRLPVSPGVRAYDHSGNLETFGLFESSLPDGWGRRLQDVAFRKEHGRLPTVLERLAMVGADGQGALVYEPEVLLRREDGTFDLARLAKGAMDFDAGLVEDVLPEVRQAGGSSGGARPKALIGYDPVTRVAYPEAESLPAGVEHWIVKFNAQADGKGSGRRELAYWRLARSVGVEMSESCLIETSVGDFFATRRFDRTPEGGRLHFASAADLLQADYRTPGDEYSVLFRLTDALTRDYRAKKELFRRAALNVLAHNRDDHLKNFGFLMDDRGVWRLAPFYDFTWSNGPNGWQTLSVAGEGADPGRSDLLRLAEEVCMEKADAVAIVDQVESAVAQADFTRNT